MEVKPEETMKRLLIAAAALALAACSSMPSWMPGGGWTTLIDGDKGMENFTKTGGANWRAEGGAIVADKSPDNSYLVTKESYGNAVIRVEFWAAPLTNSGVFVRAQDRNKIGANNAYEVNIYDARPGQEYATGGIVDHAKVSQSHKVADKWNTYEITMKGPTITVMLNGQKTSEMTDAKRLNGPFALQFGNHGKAPGQVIKFRKVQVKPL
jgi:hypothetical protein